MNLPDSRTINWITAMGCLLLMAVALFMEHVMGLEPCPLCILQRIIVIVTGLITLIAAIHGPGSNGIRTYGGLTSVSAFTGAGVSVRHLWLQSLPEDEVPACGASLDYLLDVFPLTDVLAMVLQGDGTCAEVLWIFLGISIPGWTLIAFLGLGAIGILHMVRPLKSNSGISGLEV